jgi:hypothetical protein
MQGEREVLGSNVPNYFFAVMPWLIAAQRIGVQAPPAENQGPWFTHKYDEEWGLEGELPLVHMLKQIPSAVRQDGPIPQQWRRPPTPDKLGRDWDFRLNYLGAGIKLQPAIDPRGGPVSGLYWRLVKARWLDKQESAGGSYILVKVLDLDGSPLENASFLVSRADAQDLVTTKGPIDDYWGNYTMYGLLGTYAVEMTEGGHPSERVTGVGLGTEEVPGAWTSTSFRFTFQLAEAAGDEVELRGAPATTTPNETAASAERLALHRALTEAAQPHVVPLDRSSAFYRYAHRHDLGDRLSGEFKFVHEGSEYVAQLFEKAIVYVLVGPGGRMTHAERAG